MGNAAHLMLPRHPNYIWEQLAQDQLWATVIADGFHLPDSFLKVVFRMKPETSILISDCTQFAGLPPGNYKSHIGGDVTLNSEGRLCMTDNPKLLAVITSYSIHYTKLYDDAMFQACSKLSSCFLTA